MLIKQNQSNRALRIVVLGSPKSGKSAVTVRYLTKRFIGEYSSSKDFLYHQTLNATTEIEILDTSECKTGQCIDHILWAEAFVIIYSICDLKSFQYAKKLIEKICAIKNPSNHQDNYSDKEIIIKNEIFQNNNSLYNEDGNNEDQQCFSNNNQLPVILLGNKRDLEHTRQVHISEVEEFALKFQILFYEVSAADSFVGIQLAFQNLIKDAKSLKLNEAKYNQLQRNPFCNLNKEAKLKATLKPYCCGYYDENRHLIDCYSTDNYFKVNSCGSSCSSDSSLKCDKFTDNQLVNRRKSKVKSMFGIVFGSKSSRQNKKRPSLSI